MEAVNKKIMLCVGAFGIALISLALLIDLTQYYWFIALLGVWGVIFLSSCYRITPLFKARNKIEHFIQRDAQHLLLFSLAGFFDQKLGPQWLVIESINKIETHNNELIVHSSNDRRLSISLPITKKELDIFLQRLLTEAEKQSIYFH
ncbi:hypothetical protein J8L70_15015 [Pseudoalteromonas sp. MMG010]|uniref:hypothetical protein n=1 Tax=Pseudoalteromonas sp. MMG010 TaxID=2822685 RepID=UPI001B39F95D|nr:hypothetical protein [Pseudoalteromonas sp. MMG010]MBQ4834547.1 hypothetical protein [Pseudoalteromonas sp. MMG010]